MPHYVNDPENPGQHIDANELVRRNPLTPPPPDSRIVDGLLKRDAWTRREAIAILAGADPRHAREYFHGVPIPTGYLDGTTALSLLAAGLHHPREAQIQADCAMLSSYSEGQPTDEQRAPGDWLAWAESKGFTPYWLDAARVAGLQPGRQQGDALTPGAIATMREWGLSEAQIEAQCQQAERERAAGGFQNWVVMCEAARIASEARGYTVPPENFKVVRRFETEAERLADIAQDELHATTPQLWAWNMSAELRERNPGMDYAAQCVAEAQIMRTFEAHAPTLPLRQMPSGLPWPKGEQLPPKWREGHYMTKAELRAWAKEYAPDLLGSALLAEPAGSAAPALAPDWETWRQVPKAELWEAVALSCNIKPEALPRDLAGILARELLPTHFPTKDTHQEFARRLTIAKRSTGAGGTLQTVNGSNDGAVGLAVFATWAVDVMRWAVPAELAALAEPAPEATPAGEAATIAGPPPMGNSTKGKRAHPLAAQIRKAQAQAEKAGDAAARWERGAVWAPLRAMALEECEPFTGAVSAKGLEYTDAANCRQVFTPEALAAHLKRQREKVTPADAIRR